MDSWIIFAELSLLFLLIEAIYANSKSSEQVWMARKEVWDVMD